jgi:hypothetical protein
MEAQLFFGVYSSCPRSSLRGKDADLCHHFAARQEDSGVSGPSGLTDRGFRGHILRAKPWTLSRLDPLDTATSPSFGNEGNKYALICTSFYNC